MRQPRSLLRTVGSISSATAISRVLGLVRDQVQSYYFGASMVTDAYLAAFRVPNLLRDLFAEGALSSAFVPTFTATREHDGVEAGWRLANRVFTALALILGLLTVTLALGAPWILRVYVAGFDAEKIELAVTMTRIVSPFLLFVALAAVSMGLLNACGRFFVPALAPAAFNVASIVGVIAMVPVLTRSGLNPGLALAIGAIVGGLLQFAVQIPAMRGEGFRFRPVLALRDPGVRRIAALMLPATFGLAATQINILVDTMLASRYDGAITWLQLAFRLMQLPLGLFGVAIGVANLARVSRDAARGDRRALRGNVASALRAAAVLTLPATAGLIALREPIVRVIFEHGRFEASDTSRTAAAVLCYALGLFAYSATKIQVPTFYALGDTRTPVIASAVSVSIKIVVSLALIRLLPALGFDAFLGLALSTSLAAWINFTWLGVALRRKVGPMGGERLISSALRIAVLSALMAIVCGLTYEAVARIFGGGGLLGEILRLAGVILVGLAVIAVGAWVLRVPEIRELLARVSARIRSGEDE